MRRSLHTEAAAIPTHLPDRLSDGLSGIGFTEYWMKFPYCNWCAVILQIEGFVKPPAC
jgi:hypothetical protein